MRPRLLVAAVLLVGCGVRTPSLDPTEHVRGEHRRLVHEPADRIWPALVEALDAEGLPVAQSDRRRGTLSTRLVRYADRDVSRRLGEVADLGAARGAGLRRVSEFAYSYHLLLVPAGGTDTSLLVRTTIVAYARSESIWSGGGVFGVIPHQIELPSRGVLERDLMRRMGSTLFLTEEMLFLLGEPGVD